MKVRLRHNSVVPKLLGAEGITLYPYIFLRGDQSDYINGSYYNKYSSVYRHELEHVYQVREFGYIRFYISYLLFYLINLGLYLSHRDAYYFIPYEIAARKAEVEMLHYEEIKELGL